MHYFLQQRVMVKTGDITAEDTDAIVNAANSSLFGGGGVDGAIHRKGGPQILQECRKIRESVYREGMPTGEAVATGAGRLTARFVIHTVGPVWRGGNAGEAELLFNCYWNCLKRAREKNLASIAFPAISTGIYGYPREKAAQVASRAIAGFFDREQYSITVRLVFYSPDDLEIFIKNNRF